MENSKPYGLIHNMKKFIIVKDTLKTVRRFNLTGRTLEFRLNSVPSGVDPIPWIKSAIQEVVEKIVEGVEATDKIGFSFCGKEFSRGQGWTRFKSAFEVSSNDIWDMISSIYQSNTTGLNTETFCLSATIVKMPMGKNNYRSRKYNTFDEECAKRRGIITINNKDNFCLPRALVTSMAYVNKDPLYSKIRRDRDKLQTTRVYELLEGSGVVISETGAGLDELQQFQHFLKEYKIVVFAYGSKGRDVIYKGGNNSDKRLNLLYHQGHYNVITSLTAAFCSGYYCLECYIPYNNRHEHKCIIKCPACYQSPKCPPDRRIKCVNCNRTFRGETCFEMHKKQGSYSKSSICREINCCQDCFKTIKSDRVHICGEFFCKLCNEHVPENHLCYITADHGKPKTTGTLFIFFDLETRQEKLLENQSLLHEPNLCCFKQACEECLNTEKDICNKCGLRLQKLYCDDPISPFMHHVLTMRKRFKNVVVIGHNSGYFDGIFLLNYILTKTDIKPELIMRGTKIILMGVGNVKFLDSLNYFPMALAKLPKAFGLVELKKGYFPHLFNKIENQDYVGPLPPVEYFDVDNLKEDVRQDIISWHTKLSSENYVFDFKKEFMEYCISDVEILAAACLKFRQQLMAVGNVCPFTEATTIASACNKVYRRNFLKPSTIGIIPKNGYRMKNNQSKIALQWLIWEERRREINILHAAKQEEVKIAGARVDGYCPDTKQVFEFMGCFFHGCPYCIKFNRAAPCHDDPDVTPQSRYEATVAKTERLRQKGYEVIEMWECEFRRQLQSNEEMSTYTASHPLIYLAPLNPRDAFYGGRTGNTSEYFKIKEGEQIKYVDVCSLYPYVCKYGKFPIGHPDVLTGEDCFKQPLSSLEGVIKCKILPPQQLFHPILPLKMNNKLMFVLCRTCGEQFNQSPCTHSRDERALHGVWVLDEVRKALDCGYKILEIYEIWRYNKMEQYDKVTKNGGLFTAMMNKFIKIKQEASGWPTSCNTEEDKLLYIEKFLEMEDIKLEYTEIIANPGLRSLAKLILNSFWGKFGQRENQPKTKIVNTSEEFFAMLANPALYVNTALAVNENTLVVNWEYREEVSDSLANVNVVIAAYVTALARLKLYSYLEQLEDRVLYYDTDSIIYVSRPGEIDIPTGSCIGDMTDEIESYGSGSYISEFVSGGPKNYAYKLFSTAENKEIVVCKVKGITLNYAVSNILNIETMKKQILQPSEPLCILSKNIRRTIDYDVVTKEQSKMYRPTSGKRRFSSDHTSKPYGYKKVNVDED